MAQQDYVSRGRAPQKKKTAAKRNKKEAQLAPFPMVRLVIVVTLLCGFAAFLWSIKDNVDESHDNLITREVVTDEEELPELPQEEWEYIRTLPGYEVQVNVAEQEKSDKRYLMQCASFQTRAQAESMRATIAFQGLEAQIRPTSGDNGDWFKVILGPFETKRDAEKAKHSLRKVNIATCQIWFWNQ